MPRYAIKIEYNGSRYFGWQKTAELATIQGALERAARGANNDQTVDVIGAGRTDAGVHAIGQIAHFDLPKPWRPDRLRDALNAYLHPQPIAVTRAWAVGDDFHARFSAVERRYLYRVLGRRPPPTLEAGRVWWVPTLLDINAMQDASRHLIGVHDFTTFRDAQCQAKSPIKTLDALDVGEGVGACGPEIHIVARSRSFLHRQVRSMVGALVKVGRGGWKPDDVAAALHARDRQRCAPVAPSDGLYLTEVLYPETALG